MHMHLLNFLTFPKYQEQTFWLLYNMKYDFFLLVKSGLHAKDESCSFKIERVMAIYVHQGDMKSLFQQILKSQNFTQFSR